MVNAACRVDFSGAGFIFDDASLSRPMCFSSQSFRGFRLRVQLGYPVILLIARLVSGSRKVSRQFAMCDTDISYRGRCISTAANEARYSIGKNRGNRRHVAIPQSGEGVGLRAARAGVDQGDVGVLACLKQSRV